MAAGDVNTYPYCGSCGYDVSGYNLNEDIVCDACGADISYFGFAKAFFATVGKPGAWNGVAYSTLAGVIAAGPAAQPNDAWLTGEGVWLGDRSGQISWNSITWVAGTA